MLSGETATGLHPVEAVRTMGAIIERGRAQPALPGPPPPPALDRNDSFPTAVARACVAAARAARHLDHRLLHRDRPHARGCSASTGRGARVIAFTRCQETYRRMALYWGVTPFVIPSYATTDEMLHSVSQRPASGASSAAAARRWCIASGVPNRPRARI